MKILIIPSFYPDSENPNLGFFFKQQVISLNDFDNTTFIAYTEQKSFKKVSLKNIFKNIFQFKKIKIQNTIEYRYLGLYIPGRLGIKIWSYLTYKLSKKIICDFGKPDIIHVHNCFYAGFVAERLKRYYNVPYIVTEHDSAFLNLNLNSSKIISAIRVYNNANQVIAVSSKLANSISNLGINKVVNIIPNIVDVDFFKPIHQKKNSEIYSFIAVGNLTINKNHKLLVDVIEILSNKYNVELKISGIGPEYKNLKNYIRFKKLDNHIILLGFQNRDQLLKNYNNSICLLHSSIYETFGVVLIEAMSCGIPFISTNSGGPKDIYNEAVGVILEDFSAVNFAEKIEKYIISNRFFNKNIIREYVVNKYSPKVVVEQIVKIIKNG